MSDDDLWAEDDSGADEPRARIKKAPTAFRTISEVADDLHVPQHVLRFWEQRFPQVRPLKRGGGRRYYRPEDVELLRRISSLLYVQGYTIKGVQRLLREGGLPDEGAAPDNDEPDELPFDPPPPRPSDPPLRTPPRPVESAGAQPPAPAASAPRPPTPPAYDRDALAALLAELESLRASLRG